MHDKHELNEARWLVQRLYDLIDDPAKHTTIAGKLALEALDRWDAESKDEDSIYKRRGTSSYSEFLRSVTRLGGK